MGDPTVLGMINDSLTEIKTDVRETRKDISKGAIKFENHELRICTVEKKIERIDDNQQTILGALKKHIASKTEHFNKEIADEGAVAYIARNKLKIAIITTVTTIITIGGGVIIQWLQSLV